MNKETSTDLTTNKHTSYLIATKKYALDKIINEFADTLVYHDINYIRKGEKVILNISDKLDVSQIQVEKILIAHYLQFLGLNDIEEFKACSEPKTFFDICLHQSLISAKAFLDDLDYPHTDEVLKIIKESAWQESSECIESNILSDANTIDWSKKNAVNRLRLLYQEFLLLDIVDFGRKEWFEAVLAYLNMHKYKTTYGIQKLEPKKLKIIHNIERDKKEFDKKHNVALKKELNVSDAELKSLKKNLGAVKGRDDKGIQTMFRTTSRNHYTLNQMVDRKASIMISVNAILLSLIIGRVVTDIETFCIHNSPMLSMLFASTLSIIFAILAITPTKHHGQFTEKDIRAKKGNLLFFGNYHKMSFREYEWGMLQMLNDSNFLYGSLIKDQYFLGVQLSKKYRHIRTALIVFLLGICLSFVLFIWVISMPDFHFGGGLH